MGVIRCCHYSRCIERAFSIFLSLKELRKANRRQYKKSPENIFSLATFPKVFFFLIPNSSEFTSWMSQRRWVIYLFLPINSITFSTLNELSREAELHDVKSLKLAVNNPRFNSLRLWAGHFTFLGLKNAHCPTYITGLCGGQVRVF